MALFIYIFLIILPIALLLNSNNNQLTRTTSVISGVLVYFLVIGLATYNNDWQGYVLKFEDTIPTAELFYKYLFKVFRNRGYSFEQFYRFNQLLNALLLVLFIRKFKVNSVLITVALVLILIGPTASILLRFYTSFLFFINGVSFYYSSRKKILGIIFILLSLISHYSSIIFLIFFLIHKYKLFQKSIFHVFLISILILLSKSLIFAVLSSSGYGSFTSYIIGPTSTFLGGLLAILPTVPWIFIVLRTHLIIKRKDITLDNNYVLLYGLSLLPVIFIFLAMSIQIVIYRFIEPSIIIFVVFLCYTQKYLNNKKNFYFKIYFSALFTMYSKYYLPLHISGISEWMNHYSEILESNILQIF